MNKPEFPKDRLEKIVKVTLYCQYESITLEEVEKRIIEMLPKDFGYGTTPSAPFDLKKIQIQIEQQYYDEGYKLLASYTYFETEKEYKERLDEFNKQNIVYEKWFEKNKNKIKEYEREKEIKEQKKLEEEKIALEKQISALEKKLEKKSKQLSDIHGNISTFPKHKFICSKNNSVVCDLCHHLWADHPENIKKAKALSKKIKYDPNTGEPEGAWG